MAEDYGVMLKITADTSDLEKIPQKVEATRKEIEQPVAQTVVEKREAAAPIEHPAEQVEVVEQREPAAPVEHPAEQVEVKERREAAAPIEHPAEQVEVKERREAAAPIEHPAEQVEVKERREAAAPVEHPAEQVEVVEKREAAAPIEHPAEQVEVVEQREPAAPIEHPAETVKVDVEQPKPVKIEAKAEKVRVEVEDAEAKKRIEALTKDEGVKRIRVVSEDGKLATRSGGKEIFEIEVDAEKARETIAALKADNRIRFSVETPAPVKVPVEKPKPVKVDVEQPKPVKIEAKAEKIRIEVEDAEAKKRIEALTEKEGVKRIRVVTEGGELASRQGGKEIFELEVDAEKARETIAALKQDARIKVAADTSAAESSITGFFGRIRNGVTAVRRTLSTVFAGFGMVSFAVMGVMSLVAGFQKLRDMATATSRAIQQIRLDAWIGGFNAAADAMIGKHQKIIALLREEQDVANKAASLATMETSQDRAQEDASRQQVRSVQLAAATDPREQARLEQQFATEDAEIARRRFNEDKQRKLAQLDNEYSIYQSRATFAADQTGNVDREIANQENIVFRARKTIENGGDREKYDKVIEAAKKRIESLKDEKKALEDLQKTAQREADYRIKQIEIVEKSRPSQSSSASQQLAAARNAALDKEDQLAQSDFDRDRARRAADADFDARFRAAQRQASAPDATEQQRSEAENTQLNMLREREDQANAELQAAEKELAEEFKKDAKDRDEARMSRARENIREAETTAVGARRQREDLETNIENRRVADAQDYFGNLARQIESSRPNDRLTAMGLSSGGSGDHTVREQADNVKLLVQLVRQQIAATKDINVNNTSIYAP